jgi:hypothetical protein
MTDVASDDALVAELTREVDDLRSRQEAVADVLRALSASGMPLQPILDQIVEAAAESASRGATTTARSAA